VQVQLGCSAYWQKCRNPFYVSVHRPSAFQAVQHTSLTIRHKMQIKITTCCNIPNHRTTQADTMFQKQQRNKFRSTLAECTESCTFNTRHQTDLEQSKIRQQRAVFRRSQQWRLLCHNLLVAGWRNHKPTTRNTEITFHARHVKSDHRQTHSQTNI